MSEKKMMFEEVMMGQMSEYHVAIDTFGGERILRQRFLIR